MKRSGAGAGKLVARAWGSAVGADCDRGQAIVAPVKERTRTVLSTPLPKMDGGRLKGTVVEVNYGPGESSSAHSHSCPVMVYVLEGAVRT